MLITKTLTKGGAASGARNLLGALRAAGAEVVALDAYAEQRRHPLRLLRTMERIYERSLHDAGTHCLRLGPPVFDLERLYKKYRPDAIQLCDVSGNTVCFSDIAAVPCPVVHRMSDFWPYHGARHYAESPPERLSFADRLLRKRIFDGSVMPDCRVAPSHWLAGCLGGKGIAVIRNAVGIPENVRPKGLRAGLLRFGFISGHVMDQRKGFMTLPPLLDKVSTILKQDIELHVFGTIAENKLPRFDTVRIVLHPPFKSSELAEVYGAFDVLLCPSLRDNSPNVVTEALAHGVPVIAQCGTGMDSYIRETTGALIDFHGPVSAGSLQFKDVLRKISCDFPRFSRDAHEYARSELAPEVIGREYLALYNRLSSEVA
ncbi:glycosyltransferase involved in cell wall biosynthesis [Pseudorhodobacter sp. 4114]|nr:glycosyltransferase involved in cell wall biosynthesis [Pseudorhodobacter sp. 4114]